MTELSPLLSPQSRSCRGGRPLKNISLSIEVMTPILGGSSEPRTIDDVDVVRPATVRGHLRFWWRALYAVQFPSAEALYEREQDLTVLCPADLEAQVRNAVRAGYADLHARVADWVNRMLIACTFAQAEPIHRERSLAEEEAA